MLPFSVRFRPGLPAYEQVLYGVKKALVAGQLSPGDQFPSVRILSQELRINPNTAHKVVSALVAEGLLEVRPGIGTVVAAAPIADREQRRRLLERDVEQLVVEAKTLSLELEDVEQALRNHWNRLRRNRS